MSIARESEIVLQIPKDRSTDWLPRTVGQPFQLAECESFYWLRAADSALEVVATLSQIPGKQFRLSSEHQLTEMGKTIASVRLPELEWKPIHQCLELQLPAAAFPARAEFIQPEVIRLQRTAQEAPPSAGLYLIDALQEWGERISNQRLNCLSYAHLVNLESSSCILLVGSPLPNINARFFWKHGPAYLPVGFSWNPPVPTETIAKVFNLQEEEFLLWTEDDRSLVIPNDSLQPLSRSALRAFANSTGVRMKNRSKAT